MKRIGLSVASLALAISAPAAAQYPPPQPAPQPAPQPYPPPYAQPAPLPQAQPYPQQYPQQQQRPPGYAQPYPGPQQQAPGYAPYPNQAYGQPYMQPQTPRRGDGEMGFLYGTSIAFGAGTGVWVDSIAHVTDPGLFLIAPLAFGAAAPIGVYFWDRYQPFDAGVPSSIATGLLLGGLEGVGIAGLQWQATGNGGPNTWGFGGQTSAAFVGAIGGGVGGYAFGEWLHPNPNSLTLIASGAAWGTVSSTLFGAGITKSGGDWKDTGSVFGFVGFNAGIAAAGAIATVWVPSDAALENMWAGYTIGTVGASIVYVFYLFSSAPVWHGLIANSLGGLAGLGIAGALSANLTASSTPAPQAYPAQPGYPPQPGYQAPHAYQPPFYMGFSPTGHGGGVLTASGMW